MSIAVSLSFVPCAWCGLLSEAGPVCSICGSPVLDIASWTTVLDVSWPLEPDLPPPAHSPEVGHQWVTLGQVADLFRVPEPSLRSWLEEAPGSEEPRLLLIEPGIQRPPTAICAPGDPADSLDLGLVPPPMPEPPPLEAVSVPASPEVEPSVPSLWVAPAPAPVPSRLGAAWAFQPAERERRLIRMEMLKARGATILAMGIGGTGAVYLIDRALR